MQVPIPEPTRRVLADRYEVGQLAPHPADRGCTAAWRHGRDLETGSPVSVVFLKPEFARIRDIRETYEFGLTALQRLDHPGLLRILHRQSDPESNELVYVTEEVPGRSLSRMLCEGEIFTERQACNIVVALLDALIHAHSRGVCFGNVKPSNVWISTDRSRIMMSGLPKPQFEFRSIPQLGAYLGRPFACAPEILRTGSFDARADVYGAGLVLLEICAGQIPFDRADNLAVLFASILEEPLPSASRFIPDITRRIEEIIARAVAKDRDTRFSDAAQMRDALSKTPTRPAPLLSRERLATLVTLSLPFPIAHTVASIDVQTDEAARLNRLVDAAVVTIQFLASAAMGQRIAARESPFGVAEIGDDFGRPSLGHWAAILREAARAASSDSFPELGSFWFDGKGKATRAAKAIEHLLSLRNEVRHGTGMSAASARRELAENRPHLDSLLAEALFLRNYRLFVPRSLDYDDDGTFECDALVLQGTDATGVRARLRLRSPLKCGLVYLGGAGLQSVMPLHPLVVYRPCPSCEEDELFFYYTAGDDRLVFRSFQKGHSLDDQELLATFERAGLLPPRG